MTTVVMLLAAFLAIVVVGGALVALYDAGERAWCGGRAAPAAARRPPVRSGAPGVAWRHLH
jgi:hypothetical protein